MSLFESSRRLDLERELRIVSDEEAGEENSDGNSGGG